MTPALASPNQARPGRRPWLTGTTSRQPTWARWLHAAPRHWQVWLGPLLAAALTFAVWQPFIRLDFDLWKADDGEYHLMRVYVFEAAVKAGEWLPRWTPDLFVGYGYPIFNFYAPGTYYTAMFLRLFGWDIYTTVQVLGVLATLLGAAGAYYLARAIFGGWLSGLIAALTFAYAPYPFITNLLIRADMAEVLGLALLPWALLAAWRAGQHAERWRVLALALALSAVILTHNLTALVALPAAAAVGFIAVILPGAGRPDEDPTPLTPALSSIALGWRGRALAVTTGLAFALGLTAFFWVPAMVEQRHVQIEVALDGGHKSWRSWLIDPIGATEQTQRSGNPQTPNGPLDLHVSYPYDLNYPPKPSLGQGALAITAVLVVALGLATRTRGAVPPAVFCAGTAIIWLLTTTWGVAVWEQLPLMRFLQFSWRLYGPLALGLGLAAAGAAAVAAQWATTPRLSGARMARTAAPAILAALVIMLAFGSTASVPLWLNDQAERRVGGPQQVATENTLFGAGTTTGGEFVPRVADFDSFGPGQRRGNGVYERLYPEFGWLAGRTWVLDGQLRIAALASGVTWTDATVEAETPGTLAFRTIDFPGWQVYLDGKAIPHTLAPRDDQLAVSPGFIVVPVPAGHHRVQLAFGPTPVRTTAAAISVAALALLGLLVTWRRQDSAARPAPSATRSTPSTANARIRRSLVLALVPAGLAALACAHDAVRPALGPPAAPRASDTRLLADVVERVRQGEAQVASPSGSVLGTFVDLRRLAIGQRDRRWLYMHPPSSVSLSLRLPPAAAFQTSLALDPGSWGLEGSDGVRFQLDVTPERGGTVRVFDEDVNPRARDEQRVWLDRWIDLSAFGGQQVTITLRTEPNQTPFNDWAGWGEPAVIVQKDARRPGGGPPGPLPTPRSS